MVQVVGDGWWEMVDAWLASSLFWRGKIDHAEDPMKRRGRWRGWFLVAAATLVKNGPQAAGQGWMSK